MATFTTTGTVSSPLDLSKVQGEHANVSLSSNKKNVQPAVKVTLTSLTPHNSGTLRKINSVVIPIVYSDSFYKAMLDPTLDDVNKLIYYADIPVGAICSKFDNLKKGSKEPPTLVILTLAILAPYRSLSLGTSLLRHALHAALHPPEPSAPAPSDKKTNTRAQLAKPEARPSVNRALAHVQVGNEGAKKFYERLGFKETGIEDNYYSKMEPRGAILMVCEDIAAALGEASSNRA